MSEERQEGKEFAHVVFRHRPCRLAVVYSSFRPLAEKLPDETTVNRLLGFLQHAVLEHACPKGAVMGVETWDLEEAVINGEPSSDETQKIWAEHQASRRQTGYLRESTD